MQSHATVDGSWDDSMFMAAACHMWASKDMKRRAPVIFWQGLVRLMAVNSPTHSQIS